MALTLKMYYAALFGALVLVVWSLFTSATHTVSVPEYVQTGWHVNETTEYAYPTYEVDGYYETTEAVARPLWQKALGYLGVLVLVVAAPVEIRRWRDKDARDKEAKAEAAAAWYRRLREDDDFYDEDDEDDEP